MRLAVADGGHPRRRDAEDAQRVVHGASAGPAERQIRRCRPDRVGETLDLHVDRGICAEDRRDVRNGLAARWREGRAGTRELNGPARVDGVLDLSDLVAGRSTRTRRAGGRG